MMIMGVCQGHSLIASFSILTTMSCGPFTIAKLLVLFCSVSCDVILAQHMLPSCVCLSVLLDTRQQYIPSISACAKNSVNFIIIFPLC